MENLLTKLSLDLQNKIKDFGVSNIFVENGEFNVRSNYDVPRDYIEAIEIELKHTMIWYSLNDKDNEIDIYKIIKTNKLLPGVNKEFWNRRGGVVLSRLADLIIIKPELAKLFSLDISNLIKQS